MEDTAMVQQHNRNDDPSATDDLPFHPGLVHPRTGAPIQALGRRKDGSLIWPVHGGNGDEDENDDEGNEDDDSNSDDDDLDEDDQEAIKDPKALLRAYKAEKAKRTALRKENRDLKAKATKPTPASKPTTQEKDTATGPTEAEKRLDAQLTALNNRAWTSAVKDVAKELNADADLLGPLLDKIRKDIQDDDGTVDEDELTDRAKDLIKRKPQIAGRKARAPSGRDQGAASNSSNSPKDGQMSMDAWKRLIARDRTAGLKAWNEGRVKTTGKQRQQ